jgi:phosphoglucosamine mutase
MKWKFLSKSRIFTKRKMSNTKNNRLFGTDGIRSTFGQYPLDRVSVLKLGNAVGRVLRGSKILIGRDTRQSSETIMRLLSSGISGMSAKMVTYDCGIIPTPGLSFITDHDDFDFGIMITASHNPWTDNGIKIFQGDGEKIPTALERKLEDVFFNIGEPVEVDGALAPMDNGARAIYRDFLSNVAAQLEHTRRKEFKIVLDCANGAAFEEAPEIFKQAGFAPLVINNTPDGKNINRGCGSTDMNMLKRRVKEEPADLGIAFDGDGDRVIMVDPEGNTLDGDHILYLIAHYFLETNHDFNKIVVGTVLGNLGLEKALNKMGMRYTRTQVGDKYVYEEMKKLRSILGGEQSGHTILRAFQRTGDGILAALFFLKALFHFELAPGEVFQKLHLYPQETKNISIREKRDLEQWDELNGMIREFDARHGMNSRVLIRYSGTENLVRVMLESADYAVIHEHMEKFVHFIKSTIGT